MTQADEDFALPSQVKRTDRRPGNAGPRSSDVPGIGKDQYGRYLVNDEPHSRVTTVAGVGINQDGLRVWTERKIIDGLRLASALRSRVAVSDVGDDKTADEVLKEAKIRGGVHDAAAEGTARHDEIERWTRTPDSETYPGPPPELEADVTAAITKFLEARLSLLKVEQLGLIDFLRCAGRLDVLAIAPNGKARILDWKFGADVLSSSGKRAQYARQLSGYANFTHFVVVNPDGALTLQPADEVADIDRETAYLMHTTGGVAHLYEVPIAAAWREFQASAILHKGNSADGAPIFHEIGRPWRFEPKRDEPAPIDVDTSWLPPSADERKEDLFLSIGLRCPSCDELAAEVNRSGDWNCTSCQTFGTDYDQLTSGNDVAAAPSTEAEQLLELDHPNLSVRADAVRVIQELQDMAPVLARGIPPHAFQTDGVSVCVAKFADDICGLEGWNPIHDPINAPVDQRVTPIPEELSDLVDGEGNPLQPLAKDVGAKRGCGVCGRIGHKRGSAKCLGDADPLTGSGADAAGEDAYPTRVELDDMIGRPDPAVVPVPDGVIACGPDGAVSHLTEDDAATVQEFAESLRGDEMAQFCDGRHSPDDEIARHLRPERDDKGVTGRYECAACGLPATVAAVRTHVAAVGSGARSLDEQQAAAARLRGHEPIPDPPAQLPWSTAGAPSTDPPTDWGPVFRSALNRNQLTERVQSCQDAQEFTPALQELARLCWESLPEIGA